ncbi:MAG: PAS domain S-box protein [Candidatus Hydrogenedentes bacterium]|nr:PAS domain S-box protein [Candidatus Hydrogenedentota bacterium]
MKLNQKIMLVLIAAITLYTAVGFALNRFLILPSFRQLEIDEARKDMRRCLAALESNFTQISSLCYDWSAWDDTYAFVETPNEAYIAANLYPSWFVDNDMSIMYFFRNDASIAWGQYFDLESGTPGPFPKFDDGTFPPDHPLLVHANRDSAVQGILRTSLGPMLVVSRPILPSEATAGEVSRGTLVMGRLLNNAIIGAIRAQAQVALNIIDLNEYPIPPEAESLVAGEIRVVEESPEILRVLSVTQDFHQRNILAFDATIPRRIMSRGKAAIQLNMLAAALAGCILLLLLLAAMKWTVSAPLLRLSAHVKGVGPGSAREPVPLAGRKDEIGDVAREFNHMLARLQAEEAELIATERALRLSQARTRTILDTAPDAIVLIDMSGKIESANQAASELFDAAGRPLLGSPVIDRIAPESHEEWLNTLQRAIQSGPGASANVEAEMLGLGRDGEIVPIHVIVATTELEGTPYYTCAIRDISTLKAMQEKVVRNQHLARIGEMGATVAHEIRNPLAGMKGALQIIAGGQLEPDEQRRALRDIQGLIDRISATVEQLLRYARPITPQPESVVLRSMVESLCAGTITPVPEGVAVTIECAEGLTVQADPRLLRQVLENIWANACQAVSPGGRITWSASSDMDAVTLRLTNDGPPVPEANLPRLFEPFFTTRVEGSGLGLAVSLRIVEAHDGKMYIENREQSGVTVVVRLPQGE